MIDDPLGEYVDVFGCNEYVDWYDGLPEKIDRVNWQMKYQKPLVMTGSAPKHLTGSMAIT